MSGWRTVVWLAATTLAGLGAAAWALVAWAGRPGPSPAPAVVTVAPGSGVGAVAEDLAGRGVIRHAPLFAWLARLRGEAASVRAGEYLIPAGATPNAVLERLVAGDVVVRRLKILEGWTVRDMLVAANDAPGLATNLGEADADDLLAHLNLGDGHAEGRFFPDTYHYVAGDAAADVLRRAHAKMDAVLAAEWAERDEGLPYANAYAALTMASIIEKETSRAEDRRRVGGVFVRRLARGMRLQADPSVIYGIGTAFNGNLTRAHLNTDGPYNTYRRAGLPPTPIALPGRAAIRAALRPAAGTALYFVARGDGATVFSDTLREHNRAVRRYQLAGG